MEDNVLTFKKNIAFLAWALALVALLLSVFAMPVASANMDYSTAGATNKKMLTASMILDSVFAGDAEFVIGDEERAYLDEYGNESIRYSDILPSSNVTSEYDVQSGSLTVCAKIYTYKSASGVSMSWIPKSVSFGELTAELTYDGVTDSYIARFDGLSAEYATDAVVTYTADITVSEKTVNALINKAYNDGKAWSEYIKYSVALDEYKQLLSLYQQYLIDARIYDDKLAEYQQYLKEKAEYDEAKALFDEYEKDLEKYNSDYAEYIKYLAEKEKYDKNLIDYNKYLTDIDTVKAQLAVIDGTDKGLPTIGRPLRGAILGPTVTQVIENKDAIANEVTGVGGEVVDMAGEATENLRELFDGYFSLKGEADRYIYYSLNYTKFRDNFTDLLRALDFLYQNGKVQFALSEMGITEKYCILLAQLYYVVIALNDEPVSKEKDGYFDSGYKGHFDSTYTINYKGVKKPISYVENVPYVKDPGKAAPLAGGYPSEVEKPVEPTAVSEPTKPDVVAKPIAPTEIADPGDAPEKIDAPTIPTYVPIPDSKLIKDGEIPDGIKAVASAYESGKLALREEIVGDRIITLSATSTKKVVSVDEVTVFFYGVNGELLSSVTAERGSYVEFNGKIPEKSAPDKNYTFIGWLDSDGKAVDMTAVNPVGRELAVYPGFQESDKIFTVKWQIESETVEEEYKYGEIPVCPIAPSKPNEDVYKFVFTGWNKAPTAVVSDITYVAQFRKTPLVVDSLGNGVKIELPTDSDTYTVDCTGGVGRAYDLLDVLNLAKADMKSVSVKLDGGTVFFTFAEVVAMIDSGATRISLLSSSYSQGTATAYSFKLSVTRPDGSLPNTALRGTVSLPCEIESPENTTVTYSADGEEIPLRATITENGISASISANILYRTLTEYSINSVQYADIMLSVDKKTAKPGDTVKVAFSAPDDRRVVKLFYIDSNGEKVVITGNSFVMPADSVTVGLEFSYVSYTVRFASDGVVIYTATFKPGEMPKFPGKPVKASDGLYTYEFVGWDRELSAVTGNTVYNAVYEKKAVVKEAPKDGLIITPRVLRIIVLVLVVAIYAVAILLPCIVIVVVKIIIRCAKRAKKHPDSTKIN